MKAPLTRLLCLVIVTSTVALASSDQPTATWLPTVTALEAAVRADDAEGIKRARIELLRTLAAAPSGPDAHLIRYAIAYAGWRVSTNPMAPKQEQDDLLNDAETHLLAALKMRETAEALTLLSTVYGMKIARSPIRGITLGSRAGSAIERAAALEPDNPRVLLGQGVSKFNTPGMFGGSVEAAEEFLRRAVDRFAVQPADQPFPAWGRFDAHAWLGQVLAKRGNREGARVEFNRALELAPQSGWVRYVLLPALEKK